MKLQKLKYKTTQMRPEAITRRKIFQVTQILLPNTIGNSFAYRHIEIFIYFYIKFLQVQILLKSGVGNGNQERLKKIIA